MDREKQIEEIAREMCHLSAECKTCQICNERYHGDDDDLCYFKCVAKEIVNHGYRKQIEGKWEKFEGERFICSNCAKVFGLGSTATIYDVKRVWKYCPNCGAKMKGGEE